MNKSPQGGGDCPTQAEGTAFLKCLLMFLKVNKEKLRMPILLSICTSKINTSLIPSLLLRTITRDS